MVRQLQCKDIDNEAFLEAVGQVKEIRGGPWASRWDVTAVLSGHPEFVLTPPYGITIQVDWEQLIPQKLILAKARKLIRRGVLSGCYCGCRGDFMLTDKTIHMNIVYPRLSGADTPL